jgi:trimeric autotransporter adhesin
VLEKRKTFLSLLFVLCLGNSLTALVSLRGGTPRWSTMNPGIPGVRGAVSALVKDTSGRLYVGGGFTVAGGVMAGNIACWNPATGQWSSLATGLDAEGFALARDPSGLIYAGGYFTSAGGVAASRVACWDPATGSWAALGTGIADGGPGGPAGVLALTCDGAGNVYAGGNFTTAGGAAANYVAKWNPTTRQWSPLGLGVNNVVYALVCDTGGNLYAGGWFETAGGAPASYLARWVPTANGGAGAWSPLPEQVNNVVNALVLSPTGDLYVGGGFTAAGSLDANHIARWSPAANGGAGAWFKVGQYGIYDPVLALACGDSGLLYAGGSFTFANGVAGTAYIAKWDPAAAGGGAWSGLGKGMDAPVAALALDPGGNVYAGGNFSNADGVAADRIAAWSEATAHWAALGTGMNREVQALAFDAGGRLYAGGEFWTVGGVAASRIARWDPAANSGAGAWSALGKGMARSDSYPPFVSALMTDGVGSVYAGGYFTAAGEVAANYVARWDPAASGGAGAWFALDSGVDARVDALTRDSAGRVYVGGAFTTAGGVVVNGVAKWDPAANGGAGAWSALGSGAARSGGPAAVYALACDAAGNLYAGGWFDSAGGVPGTRGIAQWNGSVWAPLGSGLTGSDAWVNALRFDGSGSNLYAGGKFTSAGGVDATQGIARWNFDAERWFPVGDGVGGDYPQVEALAFDTAGDLYVGGRFSSVGFFISAVRIAKWSTSTHQWSPLDLGVDASNSVWWDQAVSALASDAQGSVYVGGDFTTAGSLLSPFLARWGSPAPEVGPAITPKIEGSDFVVSWPAANLGWELQAQTNSASAPLGTNWFPVPDSRTRIQMTLPINPANAAVFYRLHVP